MSKLTNRTGPGAYLTTAFSRLVRSRQGQPIMVEQVDVGSLPPKFTSAANPRTTFAHGKFEVDGENIENIDMQAAWLREHPETGVILIASAISGSTTLARHRVDAVRTALVLRGIDFSRIRVTIVANIATEGQLGMADMVLTEVTASCSRREAPLMLGDGMLIDGTARAQRTPAGLSNRPRRQGPREIRPQRPTVDWARS